MTARVPEVLFLDAGGVLVFPNWRRVSAACARHGVDVTADALAAAEPHAKRELDTALPSTDADRFLSTFERVLVHAGAPLSERVRAALQDLRTEQARQNLWDVVPSDVPAALARLRATGVRLVVVSNSNGTVGALLEHVGLQPYFAAVIDSHEVGAEKPDPRIFHAALASANAAAEATLHLGDLYHVDVVGARSAGVRAALVDPAGLYADHDCRRVASLAAAVEPILAGRL